MQLKRYFSILKYSSPKITQYNFESFRSVYNPWCLTGARFYKGESFGPLYFEWETLIAFTFNVFCVENLRIYADVYKKKTANAQKCSTSPFSTFAVFRVSILWLRKKAFPWMGFLWNNLNLIQFYLIKYIKYFKFILL